MFKLLGMIVLWFLAVLIQPWLLMLALGHLHDELPWVPALSFTGSCAVFLILLVSGTAWHSMVTTTMRGLRNKE